MDRFYMRLHHILQIKKREKREVATFVAISFTYLSIRQTLIFPIDVDKNKHMCYNPHRFRCIRQSHTENHYS